MANDDTPPGPRCGTADEDPTQGPRSVETELSFTRPRDVSPDPGAPHRLRARTLEPDALLDDRAFEPRRCTIVDCSHPRGFSPSLPVQGFARADLTGSTRVRPHLERIRSTATLGPDDVTAIRRSLQGTTLPMDDGRRLRLLYVAPEGLLMRTAGPDRLAVPRDTEHPQLGDHDAALAVHADQDVSGTPVRQLLRGLAPWMLRHDSPGRRNATSPLTLVNLWIPLQQVTRPLALMDRRSLDRRRHQLRYALPVEGFLDRPADQRVNDIWTFLHDPRQRWAFWSDACPTMAWVFDTLSTPHASFVLPGEPTAAALHRRLHTAADAVRRGDAIALRHATTNVPSCPPGLTRPLTRAIEAMQSLLASVPPGITAPTSGNHAEAFRTRALACADRVIRRSVELRAVALLLPRWPRRSTHGQREPEFAHTP